MWSMLRERIRPGAPLSAARQHFDVHRVHLDGLGVTELVAAGLGDPASDLWPLVSQLGSPSAGPDPRRGNPSLAARDADLLRAWSGVLVGIRTRQGI